MTIDREQSREHRAQKTRAQVLMEAGVVEGHVRPASASSVTRATRGGALGLGLLAVVLCVLLICGVWAVSGVYGHTAHQQGAVTLRESILQAADQCYAIEGAYPVSLGYLEKRYGLSVNRDGYDVTYEVFASNIAPTVVVKPL